MLEYKILKNQNFLYEDYHISPIQKKEIEQIRIWRNEQMDVLRQTDIISFYSQIQYFEKTVWPEYNKLDPDKILVSLYKDNKFIGYGGLVYIDWSKLNAEVSFLIAPDRMSNFNIYANDFHNFLFLIKKLAKEDLGLISLSSETYSFRDKHIRILEKLNFKLKKTNKKTIQKNNNTFDSLFHECLLNEG